MKKLVLFMLFAFISSHIWAHALWIETAATGKKGVAQEVKIFFGEYSEKSITPVAKWFSDINGFSLVAIAPSGNKITLSATPATDHYLATFTPGEEGVYSVVMHHLVKDLYHGSRLDYNSSALIKVGNAAGAAANPNVISVLPLTADHRKDKPVQVKIIVDQQPAASKEVEIMAPNGWTKKLYTDSTGVATFTPLWEGKYMVEATTSAAVPGQHNGKEYQTDWKCATFIINVRK